MKRLAEICCGSYWDAKEAALGGAKRIELNSALYLGGLTPTLATLKLIRAELDLETVVMIRPRGAGFCYTEDEFKVMLAECEELMCHGAKAAAFGCLKADRTLHLEYNKRIIAVIKKYGKEAVFHRAFDCCRDPFETMEMLIDMGVDRVLTSGLKTRALEGKEMLKALQSRYGDKIQILAGSGIDETNARSLMKETGLSQVHSSCKDWRHDPTTGAVGVNYSYASAPHELDYDIVSRERVKQLIRCISE